MRITSSSEAHKAQPQERTTPAAAAAAPVTSQDTLSLASPPKVATAGVASRWLSHLPSPLRLVGVMAQMTGGWIRSKLSGIFHPAAPAPADTTGGLARAQATWKAIEQQMGVPGEPGLFADNPGRRYYPADVWPQGQAIAGALDVAALTGDYKPVDASMKQLSLYGEKGAYSPGVLTAGDSKYRYYDDNAWLGLNFMQAYQQTGNKAYLQKAQSLFPFLQTGLHKDGGLHWVEHIDRMSRNTCSNGPAIEYALRLYMTTHDPKCLDFAKNMDQFMNSQLRSPEGLYYDSLGDDSKLDRAIYTYNQGTPVGADVLWYRLTGDKKYLDRATQTANAALDHFSQDDRLWKSAPSFNAIFFRNLLALDQVAPNPRYREALNSYLDRAWKEGRDPETGLFDKGGIGSYEAGKATVLDQSGMAQLFALQSWPKDKLLDVA